MLRYNSIFQNLSALFYIAYVGRRWDLVFIGEAIIFFIFSILMTGYGYLINDFADIDLDRLHHKPNAFANTKRSRALWILLAILIFGAVFSFPFINKGWFDILWLIWILAATSYSLLPLRLKEKGAAGLATAVIAQQTLPVALMFAAFGASWSWGVLCFILFTISRGLSSDLGHQVRDWASDSQTGTHTFAVKAGLEKARTIYMASLEVERLILGTVLIVLWIHFPQIELTSREWRVSWILPLVLIYLVLMVNTLGRSWQSWKMGLLEQNDPYDELRQQRSFDALHVTHHTFPTVMIPFYLACLITIFYLPNFIFIMIIVLVFNLYHFDLWKRLLTFRLNN